MSIKAEGRDLEDGMQVLEVAGSVEGTSDAGRVNEAVTAHEVRYVHAVSWVDPFNLNSEGEFEITITRDTSAIEEPELSTQLAAGASGHEYNYKVAEFGFVINANDTAGSENIAHNFGRHDTFPVPLVWQEDETWNFTFFWGGPAASDGVYQDQEVRVYFTTEDGQEASLPPNRRSI